MKDRSIHSYEAMQKELQDSLLKLENTKLESSYNSRDKADSKVSAYNEMLLSAAKYKKINEIREFYIKKYPDCFVDIFLELPFENSILLGYEKHIYYIEYDAYKVRKEQVLVDVDYRGSVSTTNNTLTIREQGVYKDIFVPEAIVKRKKVAFYVRVRKNVSLDTLKLDDKAFTYIDVVKFNKPSKPSTGYKLFKIFSHLSNIVLAVAFIMVLLQTIGCNFIIGRQVSYGKIESLGAGFVGFFTSPVLKIVLYALIGIYVASQVFVIINAKHYNERVSTKDFELLRNTGTQIINTIAIVVVFAFFMFTNSVSFAYCAAPNLAYAENGGIFSGLGFVQRFGEIAHLESTKAFTFATKGDAAIYILGVALSFTELLCMLYVVGRILFCIFNIFQINNNFYFVEEAMHERAKLSEKKLAEYKDKLDEFNRNIITIEDKDLCPGIYDRVPSIFSSESNFRSGKKVHQMLNGRLNFGKLFSPIIFIGLISLCFLIFDGVHNACATNLFPGSGFVKFFAYLVAAMIFFGGTWLTIMVWLKAGKLDD